jgi:hypothetical protein
MKWNKYPEVKPEWRYNSARGEALYYPVLVTDGKKISVAFAEFTKSKKFYTFTITLVDEMRVSHWAYIDELDLPSKSPRAIRDILTQPTQPNSHL